MKKRLSMLLPAVLMLVLITVSSAHSEEPPMVEKNLFSPDRRPGVAGVAAPEQRESRSGPLSVQLDGVFIYGDQKIALLRMKSQPPGGAGRKGEETSPYVRVREGDSVGEYRVTKIESRSVTLEKDGEKQDIALFAKNKISPPVQAMPTAPVAAPVPVPPTPVPNQSAPIPPGSHTGSPPPPGRGGTPPLNPNGNEGVIPQPAPGMAPGVAGNQTLPAVPAGAGMAGNEPIPMPAPVRQEQVTNNQVLPTPAPGPPPDVVYAPPEPDEGAAQVEEQVE